MKEREPKVGVQTKRDFVNGTRCELCKTPSGTTYLVKIDGKDKWLCWTDYIKATEKE